MMEVIGWTIPDREEYFEVEEFGLEEAQAVIACLRKKGYCFSGRKHATTYFEFAPVLSNLRMVHLNAKKWAKLVAESLGEENPEPFLDESYAKYHEENVPCYGRETDDEMKAYYLKEDEFFGDDLPNFALVPFTGQKLMSADLVILPNLDAMAIDKAYSFFKENEWDAFLEKHPQYQQRLQGKTKPAFPFVMLTLESYPVCFFASTCAKMIEFAKAKADVRLERQDYENLDMSLLFDGQFGDYEVFFRFRYDADEGEVDFSRCHLPFNDVAVEKGQALLAANQFNCSSESLKALIVDDEDSELCCVVRLDLMCDGDINTMRSEFEKAVDLLSDSINQYCLMKLRQALQGE